MPYAAVMSCLLILKKKATPSNDDDIMRCININNLNRLISDWWYVIGGCGLVTVAVIIIVSVVIVRKRWA